MKTFIIVANDNEYVESFDLANKTVNVISEKKDAMVFDRKYEAEYIAERLGCTVEGFDA